MIGGLTYVSLSDIGLLREDNQDYQGHELTSQGLLVLVADGMGGHAGGATASQLAVNQIKRAFRSVLSESDPAFALRKSIQDANHIIWSSAAQRTDLRGMGSTIVAAYLQEEQAFFAHVGDSRLYLLRGDVLHQMTKDHTMVQRLIDAGVVDHDEAENHRDAHKLNRSLGGGRLVLVDVCDAPVPLQEGDILLLCSDGLSGLMRAHEIGRVLKEFELHEAVRILVDEANSRGGIDNITVGAIRINTLPLSFASSCAVASATSSAHAASHGAQDDHNHATSVAAASSVEVDDGPKTSSAGDSEAKPELLEVDSSDLLEQASPAPHCDGIVSYRTTFLRGEDVELNVLNPLFSEHTEPEDRKSRRNVALFVVLCVGLSVGVLLGLSLGLWLAQPPS